MCAVAGAQAPEAGDALGAGLTPPTAARYADPAWYDLLDVRWANDANGARVVELEMAAIDADAPLLQPIVEAYLIHPEALGRTALPGTGLASPDDAGWAVAVRIAGASAWAWTAALDEPQRARALSTELVGRTVRVAWPSDLPVEGSWVAVSGVYDPFSETGWRPFTPEASPWAFAGPAATPPVVSVAPGDDEALLRLHATARLPRGTVSAPLGRISPWWWWMAAGMALVVVGLTWRGGRSPWHPPSARPARPIPEASAEAIAPVPPALIGDDDVVAAAEVATVEVAVAEVPTADVTTAEDAPADATTAEDAPVRQSAAEERSRAAATTSAEAASEADSEADEASSSSRTTRAPSEASRSAKRS
jgi:hypothetical protein